MSAPREQNQAASAGVMSNLMQLNKLTYRVPPSLSVAKERRYVENFAQQRTYGDSQTIVFNCNTGSQFLDGKRSYMTFKLKLPDATTGDLGHGSAANIFRSIRVKARSGVEICRLEGANLWTSVHQRWNCPRNAFETSLESQGYGANITGGTGGAGTDLSNGCNFVIPLHIIPCFNQSRLIPPQLADGMILELELQTVQNAIRSTAGAPPSSFTVEELKIRWDAYDLADAFDRKINEMAARDGLNLVHKEYYRTLVSGNQTDYQYDVKKSCSKALGVYVCPRLTANINSLAQDSNILNDQKVVRYQFQVGSTYYPNAPMTNASSGVAPSAQSSAEAYYYSLASWHRTDCHKDQDVDIKKFVGTDPVKMGIASTSFCKSQVSDLAGVMVNSARACNVDIQCDAAQSRRLDTYLCHARLVKVFLENAVVSD
jgi:hypothetical protein